jgi:hypothetical protein
MFPQALSRDKPNSRTTRGLCIRSAGQFRIHGVDSENPVPKKEVSCDDKKESRSFSPLVGENIFRKQNEGVKGLDGAVQGAAEVGRPVIFAVLTTVAAFWPLLLGSGTIGVLFAQASRCYWSHPSKGKGSAIRDSFISPG